MKQGPLHQKASTFIFLGNHETLAEISDSSVSINRKQVELLKKHYNFKGMQLSVSVSKQIQV